MTSGPAVPQLLVRTAVGATCSVALGFLVYGPDALVPELPHFQVVTVGILMSAVVALWEGGAPRTSALLVAAFAVQQMWTTVGQGWTKTIALSLWCVIVGAGLVHIGLIWTLLDRQGLRFGKGLIAGPLLAGVFFAATPAAALAATSPSQAMRTLVGNLLLGVVIGDGVGLGIEIVDLALRPKPGAAPV